jgi:hypothetical protein
MCNSPSITKAIVVATLAAMLIPASFARADTNGIEEFPFVAASLPADGDRDTQPLTCKERREIAWFNHEMQRTDGDVSPEAPNVACGAEPAAD